jgi:lysyl-tRNA synthetase class 2
MSGDASPTASLDALRLRAAAYADIRAFFAARDVLEVETPILSAAGNTDPNIESFETQFSGPASAGDARRWLRTSPEYPLKRLLAAGIGDCYELGRVFRNGEAGRRHNPEFTMLEWYRVGWDHHRLMDEVAELVALVVARVGRALHVERITYRTLYRERLGLDPFTADDASLRHALGDVRIEGDGLGRDDWLDLLMTHRLQPAFPDDRLTFVHDYPASQCALARIRGEGSDAVAERFEAYLGSQELANGYHELVDAAEQRARFERDLDLRAKRGAVRPQIDDRLLAALQSGLPDCAGVALGVERLLLAMRRSDDIASVLAFPFASA